jgi:hypothetical protein
MDLTEIADPLIKSDEEPCIVSNLRQRSNPLERRMNIVPIQFVELRNAVVHTQIHCLIPCNHRALSVFV